MAEQSFDGYDGETFVAQVVRCDTLGPFPAFEHLGWHWRAYFTRHGMSDVDGEFASPAAAQRAVEQMYRDATTPRH